jgi:hypothetical protein
MNRDVPSKYEMTKVTKAEYDLFLRSWANLKSSRWGNANAYTTRWLGKDIEIAVEMLDAKGEPTGYYIKRV